MRERSITPNQTSGTLHGSASDDCKVTADGLRRNVTSPDPAASPPSPRIQVNLAASAPWARGWLRCARPSTVGTPGAAIGVGTHRRVAPSLAVLRGRNHLQRRPRRRLSAPAPCRRPRSSPGRSPSSCSAVAWQRWQAGSRSQIAHHLRPRPGQFYEELALGCRSERLGQRLLREVAQQPGRIGARLEAPVGEHDEPDNPDTTRRARSLPGAAASVLFGGAHGGAFPVGGRCGLLSGVTRTAHGEPSRPRAW